MRKELPLSVLVIDVTDEMAEKYWLRTPWAAEYNAIIETVKLARALRVPVDVVEMDGGGADCGPVSKAIRDEIPASSRMPKDRYSAFLGKCRLRTHLKRRGTGRILVMGFDRDICVIETVHDGLREGFKFVTSEKLLLTKSTVGDRDYSMSQFRRRGISLLHGLDDVRKLLRKEAERRKARRKKAA